MADSSNVNRTDQSGNNSPKERAEDPTNIRPDNLRLDDAKGRADLQDDPTNQIATIVGRENIHIGVEGMEHHGQDRGDGGQSRESEKLTDLEARDNSAQNAGLEAPTHNSFIEDNENFRTNSTGETNQRASSNRAQNGSERQDEQPLEAIETPDVSPTFEKASASSAFTPTSAPQGYGDTDNSENDEEVAEDNDGDRAEASETEPESQTDNTTESPGERVEDILVAEAAVDNEETPEEPQPAAPVGSAPTDLLIDVPQAGIALNTDGGNNTYLQAQDGDILADLSTFTFEISFSVTSEASNFTPIVSYAAAHNNEFLIGSHSNEGKLAVFFRGQKLSTTIDTDTLYDGEQHHLAVTRDASDGSIDVYVDGSLAWSADGVQTGQNLRGGGEMIFGQEQDSVGGRFASNQVFEGTLFDVVATNDVRSSEDIAGDAAGGEVSENVLVHWPMNNLEAGNSSPTDGSNGLIENQATGNGFVGGDGAALITQGLTESATAGQVVATLGAVDPDVDATHTFEIVGSSESFVIVGNELRVKEGADFDHETRPTESVTIRVTDENGLTLEETVSFDVGNVDEAPTGMSIDNTSVAENDEGAVIGNLTVADEDTNDTYTYSVSDDRFEVVNNQLKLKDGVSLDHEEASSVTVEVTVHDAGAVSGNLTQSFTVDVSDVHEVNTITGTNNNETLNGTNTHDVISALDGNDNVRAGSGNDVVSAGSGNDYVSGGDGNDQINGDAGNDRLYGDAGADELRGGAGNDLLYADAEDTVVDGGDGYDRVIVQGGGDFSIDQTAGSVERVDAGDGNDTLDASGMTVSTTQIGNAGDDTIIGGDARDVQRGGVGNDTLSGNGGNDDIRAGDGNDTISGGTGNDYILGEAGNDIIDGGDGNDRIIGGAGADELRGGDGDDLIYAEAEDTVVDGGTGYDRVIVQGDGDFTVDQTAGGIERVDASAGNDTLDASGMTVSTTQIGNAGDDTIIGGDARDVQRGGVGNDTISGNGGNDDIRAGDGYDTISGGTGNDYILGEAGDDNIDGGDGNDRIIGGAGADEIRGGAGNDILYVDAEDTVVDGGDGYDRVIVQGSGNVSINQTGGGIERVDAGAGNDTLDASGMTISTTQIGNAGDDTIIGGDARDVQRGGVGNDVLSGNGGNDDIRAGEGNDTISGGTGNDYILGEAGNDVIDGGDGNDRIIGGAGADELRGGAGNDLIYADGEDTVVEGGDGYDRVIVQGTSDFSIDQGAGSVERVDAGSGDDTLDASGMTVSTTQIGNAGDDTIIGGEARDVQRGGTGNDTLSGNGGNDDIRAGEGNDTIDGGTGADYIRGEAGNDIIDGGADNDRIFGDAGDDELHGGAGNDQLYGGDGNDVIHGGTGNDYAAGGEGDDSFFFGDGSGNDRFDGGAGWQDVIDLSGGDGTNGTSGDWTINLEDGTTHVITVDSGSLDLGSDASGTIVLSDGSELDFENVEHLQW